MTEADVENATLDWLAALGWEVGHGPDLSPPDARTPGSERDTYRDGALKQRLRDAIRRLNPDIPTGAQDEACRMVLNPNVPGLLQANRQMHRWLVEGVPVQYQRNGETRGDRVRLVDWADAARNDWLALNQLSIQGPKATRRPDVVLFLNGLPVVVLELKNPGDENADLWAAFNQLQAYKEDVPDLFQSNGLLVISDGIEARMGSLTARNRAIETAQVIEELIEMAKKFHAAAQRGEQLGLNGDEMAFYNALATNAAAVRALGDETLKAIAVELTQKLRASVTVDWAVRETVRARLRVMVKTLLKRYKYPPDRQDEATETVLRQAESLSAEWSEG